MVNLDYVVWIVTARCNLQCRHCYAKLYLGEQELARGEKLLLARQLCEAGVPHINLTGGEPLLRPDMPKILEYANGKLTILFSTNGTLINSSVAKMLGRANVKRVSISLDGATQATHERFRGEGTF